MSHLVSGFIMALNEVRSIEGSATNLAKYVDDLLIMDCGSDDGTLEILIDFVKKTKHARLIYWPQYAGRYAEGWQEPLRRNWACMACLYDWIITIDGDELMQDVPLEFFRDKENAVKFGTQNILDRKLMTRIDKHPTDHGMADWYPDFHVRFFNRRKSYYSNHPLHCAILDKLTNTAQVWTAEYCGYDIFHYHGVCKSRAMWRIDSSTRPAIEVGNIDKPLPAEDHLIQDYSP